MFSKQKRIRLTGKKLAALNAEIHTRDNHKCILCSNPVDPREKFHHEPVATNKQDRIECGVTLCRRCHDERHFGKLLREFRCRVEEYLGRLYPAFWDRGMSKT